MRYGIAISMLLACAPCVHAATFCVSTPAQFQAAYDTARGNNQSNTIRMRAGTYLVPGGGIGSQAKYDYDSGGTLLIEGGWTGAASSCSTLTNDASLTVVDGGGLHRGMLVSADTEGLDVTVRNLTFENARALIIVEDDEGAGLKLEASSGTALNVTVDRCIFRDNQAAFLGGGLYAAAAGGVLVRNSLFVGNSSVGDSSAMYVLSNGLLAVISNNTVTGNSANDSTSNAATIITDGDATFLLENNIIWDNTTSSQDDVFGPSAIYVRNIIEKVEGAPQPGSALNASVDPQFSATGDFTLTVDSPAIDAGENDVYGGIAAVDLANKPRLSGPLVDLGAYEATSVNLFKDGFE